MNAPRYTALIEEIGRLNTEVKEIFDRSDAAGGAEIDAETWKKVKTNNQRIEELEHQAAEILAQQEAKNAADRRDREAREPATRLRTPGAGQQPESKAEQRAHQRQLADQVLDDPEFTAWRERLLVKGNVSRAQFGNSPGVEVKTLLTGLSSTSAGALVVNDRKPIIDMGTYYRPITILDMITRGQTGSDTVEYVREGTHTNNAAVVAEATGTSNGTGAKPESAMLLSVVTEAVKTIAHWIPATRRALADAGQLRTLIEAFLRYGLDDKMADQVLNGDGVGDNFTGILNTSGTTAQAYDTNLLTTTRRARTKVMTTGRARPTAYVMNPLDWEDFDLLVDSEARYYFGGPSVLGTPRLWGLPVAEEERMPEGTAMVADWRLAALWDREASQILISDSHSDFFVRNLIAILAEMRAAFGVLRPAAFVVIDLTA